MPTVAELKEIAKSRGIRIPAKAVKAEIEELLGMPVTGKPRSSSPGQQKPAAVKRVSEQAVGSSSRVASRPSSRAVSPSPAAPPVPTEDVVLLMIMDANDEQKTYLIKLEQAEQLKQVKQDIASYNQGTNDEEKDERFAPIKLLLEESVIIEDSDSGYEVPAKYRVIYTALLLQ